MGLDSVEIIMEIEEAFDIRIPDDEATKIRTVGELYDFVIQETRDRMPRPADDVPARTDLCLTAATFYLVRRNCARNLGCTERRFARACRSKSCYRSSNAAARGQIWPVCSSSGCPRWCGPIGWWERQPRFASRGASWRRCDSRRRTLWPRCSRLSQGAALWLGPSPHRSRIIFRAPVRPWETCAMRC